ncbi:MAG: hypothetical protein BIFFINMI_00839 [Phycisphaerae bacterium]|nr:hypothetical protein [Phycisphaerae bacterium]
MAQSGHRVTMIAGGAGASKSDPGGPATENIDGIEVHFLNVAYSNAMSFRRRWMAFNRFCKLAARVAVASRADLVFATSTPLNVGKPGRDAARRLGVPFVFEVRDIWPQLAIDMGLLTNPLLKWYLRRMEVSFYRAAAHVVILAPGMKEHIAASGVSPDDITFIPNSCDLDIFRPDAPRFDHPALAGDAFKLVFTGAHGRANGLDAVLDAAAVLKQRGVTDVRFIFIGSGGLKPGLQARAKAEGLDALVAFHDPVSKLELAGILPHVDVGMQILANVPGFYNGTSPNKFFDYIAAGLPVLTNYPGWLAGLIETNRCGCVAPPDDPAAFADAVLWMRDHRDELKPMGVQSRLLAEREFGRDAMADRFIATLQRVQAESGKNR